jgi:4-hydroxy-tetrahydrodipicolinate reductase
MNTPHTVAIIGAKGRMGQALTRLAPRYFSQTIALDQGDDLAAGIEKADAIIEFAHHSVTPSTCNLAVKHHKPLVIGTTGHNPDEIKVIHASSTHTPIVFSANYSVGVNLLLYLTEIAATALNNKDYDQEIIEMHHRHKIDAPSGTAKMLLNALLKANDLTSQDVRHGRQGEVGARSPKEIGVHALRGGDVIGDHTVIFAGQGERIELTHKASNRDIFASGALMAAQWLLSKLDQRNTSSELNTTQSLPGRPYDMQDVLGLSKH